MGPLSLKKINLQKKKKKTHMTNQSKTKWIFFGDFTE